MTIEPVIGCDKRSVIGVSRPCVSGLEDSYLVNHICGAYLGHRALLFLWARCPVLKDTVAQAFLPDNNHCISSRFVSPGVKIFSQILPDKENKFLRTQCERNFPPLLGTTSRRGQSRWASLLCRVRHHHRRWHIINYFDFERLSPSIKGHTGRLSLTATC